MKMVIEIEIDDRAPNEELCGEGCKGFNKGVCHIFNTTLKDNSINIINNTRNGVITYDDTKKIDGWERCKQCIELFYSFGTVKNY